MEYMNSNTDKGYKEQRARTSGRRSVSLKMSLFLIPFILAPFFAQAQTWSEWFSQKKTQKKYLLNQIAALQVYIGYARKGYDIVSGGIHTVRDIKNGEFGLHSAFFGSLKAVSPAIRNNIKVAEIIDMQLSIARNFGGIRSSAYLSGSDRDYIATVREKVLEDCTADLEELLLVITAGKVEMADGERIRRLDGIHAAMTGRYAFARHFTAQAQTLIGQRKSEQGQAIKLKKLYDHEKDN